MRRRTFVKGLSAAAAAPLLTPRLAAATSVDDLDPLVGELTLYLGRGEGGLYENVLEAIEKRNPDFTLKIRRGPTAALANVIVAEAGAGVRGPDVFWAVDSGAIGLVSDAGLAKPLPTDLTDLLQEEFRFERWAPVTGRIRTLPFHTGRLQATNIPDSIMALPDSDLSLGWAPAYASFQSFVTAMRILQGDADTEAWLRRMDKRAKPFAGELGVVMAAERGEVDVGLANHYYTLRLKSGKPDASVDLAFTRNDAGCLVNASGVLALNNDDLTINFIRYLFTTQVQSFLAREAYEIPLVSGVNPPAGLPPLDTISPPKVDLTLLADLKPTLDLMRKAGVL